MSYSDFARRLLRKTRANESPGSAQHIARQFASRMAPERNGFAEDYLRNFTMVFLTAVMPGGKSAEAGHHQVTEKRLKSRRDIP